MEVQKLGGKASPRTSYAKDGFTISDHGNLLMDAEFEEVDDIPLLNQRLKKYMRCCKKHHCLQKKY